MEKNVRSFQIMLSAMIILAFLAMPFTVNAQAGKANFSGTWAFNAEKSNMGQPPQGQGQGQRPGGFGGGGGGDFVAKQEANLLTVERTRGDQTITSKYTLDGKESINSTGRGESKSIATWSADGKTLTIVTSRTFDMQGETRTVKTTEAWSLTSPSTLSIVTTRDTQQGERKTTAVYDKK